MCHRGINHMIIWIMADMIRKKSRRKTLWAKITVLVWLAFWSQRTKLAKTLSYLFCAPSTKFSCLWYMAHGSGVHWEACCLDPLHVFTVAITTKSKSNMLLCVSTALCCQLLRTSYLQFDRNRTKGTTKKGLILRAVSCLKVAGESALPDTETYQKIGEQDIPIEEKQAGGHKTLKDRFTL